MLQNLGEKIGLRNKIEKYCKNTKRRKEKYEIIKVHSSLGVSCFQKTRGLCFCKSLLALGHSCTNRYSRTNTCISSSRSILQIMLRAPL